MSKERKNLRNAKLPKLSKKENKTKFTEQPFKGSQTWDQLEMFDIYEWFLGCVEIGEIFKGQEN